jgi:hypothetical protein
VCDVETFSDKLDGFFGRGCSDCRPRTIEEREDDFRGREREASTSRRRKIGNSQPERILST